MRLESDQKDMLISELKAKLFEKQHQDKDYYNLQSQLLSLEHKFNLLSDEKVPLICLKALGPSGG